MKIWYSGNERKAYRDGEPRPPNCVELDDTVRQRIGLPLGAPIDINDNGDIVLLDPEPTTEQLIKRYDAALVAHIDSIAQQSGYDNRISFAVRAGFDGPYRDEATAFAQWMDACNSVAYEMLADVANGERDIPTIDEMIAALPTFSPVVRELPKTIKPKTPNKRGNT